MGDPLGRDSQEWLTLALGELVAQRGAEPLLRARILEPTPRDFPDPFQPDAAGVRVLLRRLLAHAGLGEYGVDLITFSQPDEIAELDHRAEAARWGHEGTAAWFSGIRDGRCGFGIAEERIGEPTQLVGALCHEVAHAWRSHHGLVLEGADLEEPLTDVTTVYLGFGLLTTNAAYTYRAGGELREGGLAVTRWSHARAGYLVPEAMSFLLALQARARGLGWWERRRLAARLEANQAGWFRWAVRRVGSPAEVRERLGLGAPPGEEERGGEEAAPTRRRA